MSARFLHGCDVLVPGGRARGLGVLLEGGRIAAVLPAGAAPAAAHVALPPECLLAPGLIDVQVNGGGGVLFNDTPTVEAALEMAAAHRRLGTTAILPTLITSEAACMRAAASVLVPAVVADAGVMGLHFEGPF